MPANVQPVRRRPETVRLPALAQAIAAVQVQSMATAAAIDGSTAASLAGVAAELTAVRDRLDALETP